MCVSAAAEQDFVAYVSFVKQLITDPDKHLTREEKVTQLFTSSSSARNWSAVKANFFLSRLLSVISKFLCLCWRFVCSNQPSSKINQFIITVPRVGDYKSAGYCQPHWLNACKHKLLHSVSVTSLMLFLPYLWTEYLYTLVLFKVRLASKRRELDSCWFKVPEERDGGHSPTPSEETQLVVSFILIVSFSTTTSNNYNAISQLLLSAQTLLEVTLYRLPCMWFYQLHLLFNVFSS